MARVFEHRFTVSREALDGNGHVNNVEYVRWMQDAAILHSDAAGCTRETEAAGATWVVRSHRIEYLRPVFLGEEIAVLTWVSNFRRARSLRKYKMLRVADEVVLAKAETEWVFIDAQSHRPRLIPEIVSRAFEIVPGDEEP